MKNLKQNTSDLIMIEPMHFGFNTETAEDNHYQIKDDLISKIEIKQKAIKEFNELVKKIKEENISVRVFGDEKNIITTDSVFPNNWISLHKDGKLILYPMFSKNRRKERQNSFIKSYLNKAPDVVMSDMAVNTTGIKNLDSMQTCELCREAIVFSKEVISEKGFFISKIFMGSTFNEIVALAKKIFKEVKVFKPKSSRKDSKESFIVCKNLR